MKYQIDMDLRGDDMHTKRIKVAMGQMLVTPGEPGHNLRRAKGMIRDAAEQGCAVIVLPECLDLGWTYPDAPRLAQPIPGAYSDEIAQAAREYRIYVVAGLTERAGERLYNAAVFMDPDGQVLIKHRKINELSIAHHLYSRGDSLVVTETPFGIVGINICADNSPDSLALGHSLGQMGARLLLSPCAWAVPADYDNILEPYGPFWKASYKTLAQTHHMTIVGVSNVGWVQGGEWDGWKCIGCSLAVGPNGIIAEGPYGDNAESLILIEVDVEVDGEADC